MYLSIYLFTLNKQNFRELLQKSNNQKHSYLK
jgi:hypothetical protein